MPVQPPLSARPHQNQQLFADHYLDRVLPARPGWAALAAAAAPVMAACAAIVAAYTPSTSESQTEDGLIKPCCALGHTFEVQVPLKTPDGTKKPDYVLYRDAAALLAHKNRVLTDAVAGEGALAVGDAKSWNLPLDQAVKRAGADPFTNKNPAYQIAFYMQHSGVPWGILTNGRRWRLYHRDTAHKLDHFYEVDLLDLLAGGDVGRFLYFYAFFSRAAFEPTEAGLARILQGSADYARGVGDTLKSQVYDALRHLAQGFLDYPPNRLTTDPADLKRIYDATLIALYRLLFVLYAEARGLLPVAANTTYRLSYSLDAIKGEVAHALNRGQALLPRTATLWPRLQALWRIIDEGDPALGVATYNGGLFDAARHPFLEQYAVGDGHLQCAVDMLARVGRDFVDYRDLAVRHLGTIYEGLLEYHLEPRAEPGWSVALLNDKGERKATGSYYTPDYVVNYMVAATLGPLLDAALAGQPDDAARARAVLALNVLDPAMGSGHFLVEATEYLARRLVELGVPPPDRAVASESDLPAWKRRIVQACIYGVDLNPLAVELAKLALWLITVARDRPLSFLDHHLRAGNALVGAHLADLQRQAAAPAPRPRRKEQQAAAAGQLSWLEDAAFQQSMGTAVDVMWLIEGSAAETAGQVKEQEHAYAGLQHDLTGQYGRRADSLIATSFGVPLDPALWTLFTYKVTTPKFAAWQAEVARVAAERRFFHWELAFPEVFFDAHGAPRGDAAGFDAVIGNPPYVRQEALAAFKPYFAAAYPEVAHGTADLFVYFIAQGLHLLRRGGRLAYISSNSWLRANYATPLRAHLRAEVTVESLIDLGDNRVFADAPDVYPAILVLRRDAPAPDQTAQAAVFTRGEGLQDFADRVVAKLAPVAIHNQDDSGWQMGDDEERRIFAKLMASGTPLGEVVGGQMYRGVLTGLNEAFIVDQATRDRLVQADPPCSAILKPILRGEDLRPWYQENEGRWIIVLPAGWTATTLGPGLSEADAWTQFATRYPGLAGHLLPFADAARKRQDKGQFWWELRPCDYYPAFEQPKIFWPELTKQPRFSWDVTGAFVNNKGYILPTDALWLLGLLNSRAIWLVVMKLCLGLGERAGMERFQLFAQYITRLPIPAMSPADREAIGGMAQAITEQAQARYTLHRKTRHRLLADLGTPGQGLNERLTAWWTLDFAGLQAALHKVFKRTIPPRDRDGWEEWFAGQCAAHRQCTDAIVAHETALNARVSALFALTPAEIAVIAQSTKYPYGAV